MFWSYVGISSTPASRRQFIKNNLEGKKFYKNDWKYTLELFVPSLNNCKLCEVDMDVRTDSLEK